MLLKDNFDKRKKEKVEKFIDSKQKYIFGRNVYTKAILKKIKNIKGIIDDFYKEDKYLNLPVFKLNHIPKNADICVVSGGNILSAINRVKSEGFENVIHYADLIKYSQLNFQDFVFNENFKNIFEENKNEFLKIYNLLCDNVSKTIFQKIISFRYFYNIDFLKGFKNREKEQYFEDFLNLGQNEIFVDVGAYDGFTSLEFIKRVKKYKKIYIFEPDEKNLLKAKINLKNYDDIIFINSGAYDKKTILKFKENDSASTISEEGDLEIKVNRIDNLIKKATFIKMDVEGAEIKALKGAENIIANCHPKMAISVYHNPLDFIDVPKFIFDLVGNDVYDVYIRHYTESIYETIMFFIPKG